MLGEGSIGDYAVASLDRSVTATIIVGALPELNGQDIGFTIIAGVANATLFLNGSDLSEINRVPIEAGALPDLSGQEITATITATIEPVRLALVGKEITFITPLHGGGSDRRKPKNYRTGLEPVRKLPPQKIEVKKKPVPLPPFRPAPRTAPVEVALPVTVDRSALPNSLLGLQDEIYVAQDLLDESDIEEILSLQDGDVGEILMLLDSLD